MKKSVAFTKEPTMSLYTKHGKMSGKGCDPIQQKLFWDINQELTLTMDTLSGETLKLELKEMLENSMLC